jgi:hypothetical protein
MERVRGGSRRALELEAPTPAPAHDQEIELRAPVRGPPVTVTPLDPQPADHRLQGEALPRGAERGMSLQVAAFADPEERVQQAAVCEVDLGRAHLPLGDVFAPREQDAHGKGRGQTVEIAAHQDAQ